MSFLALAVAIAALLVAFAAFRDSKVEAGARDESSAVVVPSVVGMSLTEATTRLVSLGFVVRTEQQPRHNVPPNTAFAQQPVAGAESTKSQTVTLLVSSGP